MAQVRFGPSRENAVNQMDSIINIDGLTSVGVTVDEFHQRCIRDHPLRIFGVTVRIVIFARNAIIVDRRVIQSILSGTLAESATFRLSLVSD
jgi:hypothetical protein